MTEKFAIIAGDGTTEKSLAGRDDLWHDVELLVTLMVRREMTED